MPIATCIKTYRGGPKSYFKEGNEYNYTKHEAPNGNIMYSVTGDRQGYVTMFVGDLMDGERKFSYYFASTKELREKKIKYLLAGDK